MKAAHNNPVIQLALVNSTLSVLLRTISILPKQSISGKPFMNKTFDNNNFNIRHAILRVTKINIYLFAKQNTVPPLVHHTNTIPIQTPSTYRTSHCANTNTSTCTHSRALRCLRTYVYMRIHIYNVRKLAESKKKNMTKLGQQLVVETTLQLDEG